MRELDFNSILDEKSMNLICGGTAKRLKIKDVLIGLSFGCTLGLLIGFSVLAFRMRQQISNLNQQILDLNRLVYYHNHENEVKVQEGILYMSTGKIKMAGVEQTGQDRTITYNSSRGSQETHRTDIYTTGDGDGDGDSLPSNCIPLSQLAQPVDPVADPV